MVDTISNRIVKNVIDNVKVFVIKILLLAIFLLTALLFAIVGIIKLFSEYHIFDSGLGLVIVALVFFGISIAIFNSISKNSLNS
jgi:hypothetical protein